MVLEGGDAFGRAHGGMKLFDYMGTDERFSKLFNQTGFTIAVVKKALEVYQGFKDVDVLVDVGGGVGNTLGVVTSKYPNIKGVNFDLTCALAQAPSYPGVEHVAGDMFVEVPKGDAMILKVSSLVYHSYLLKLYVLVFCTYMWDHICVYSVYYMIGPTKTALKFSRIAGNHYRRTVKLLS